MCTSNVQIHLFGEVSFPQLKLSVSPYPKISFCVRVMQVATTFTNDISPKKLYIMFFNVLLCLHKVW